MKHNNISYTCDVCGKELGGGYRNTDGEGGSYFMWDVYNEVPLNPLIKGCKAARVKATVGGKDDKRRFGDVCNKCKLGILKQAVAYYEGMYADENTENADTDTGNADESTDNADTDTENADEETGSDDETTGGEEENADGADNNS